MEDYKPKFSILCLTFGQSKFRLHAIKSVLIQNYPNWELILIDPSSETFNDSSVQEILSSDERIISLEIPDSGPAEGLNNGLQIASGEFIVCLNGDDFFLKDCFSTVAEKINLNKSKDFAVIHGDAILVDEAGKNRKSLFSDKVSVLNFSTGECAIPHPSTFYSRRYLIEKKLKFNKNNRTCWDAEMVLDILQSGGIFLRVRDYLSAFRLHPNSISGSGRLMADYEIDKNRIVLSARKIKSFSSLTLYAAALFLILRKKLNLRSFK